MKRLWYIDGKTYDLAPFIAKHPGGKVALALARGADCTELFRSYHLLGGPGAKLLEQYEVTGDARAEPQAPNRFTFENGEFYLTLQSRVRAHFGGRRDSVHASRAFQLLAAAMIVGTIALMIPAFFYGSVVAALAHGFLRAMTSIGPGHSMSHFSLFPRGRWNMLVFRALSPVMISNPAIWGSAHVVSHHVDTLTPIDLQDNYPFKRIQAGLRHRPWHRAQHFYTWLIYILALPLWSAQDLVLAFISLFTGKHGDRPFSFLACLENTAVFALNIFLTVVLPFLFLPVWDAFLVSAASNVVASLLLVVQIAVNHEVPETSARSGDSANVDWGVHQVLTSHNFGVDSNVALHLSGGLNMQIEHHLFPGIHYTHFRELSKIVRRTCTEFGLPYHTSTSIFEAVQKHYTVLRSHSVP